MQLETDRLILWEFAADDWQDLNAYTSDRWVVQYVSFGPAKDGAWRGSGRTRQQARITHRPTAARTRNQ
jgi:hypothetical protein